MDTTAETTQATRRRWSLVKQNGADSYLLVLMASFGATVIIVRLLLELSGYPQIGDNTYHLAHLLWGGLLLFLGLLLLLLVSNRWVIWVVAVMGGAGVGLFIDEVGKFITQSNDYFFPLAFPIIYAFMLVCVWIYLRIRRHRPSDTRTLLYHALDDLKQVLDNDLDPFEHSELLETLDRVAATATDSNERLLALHLRQFVTSKEVRLASSPQWIEQTGERVRFWLARYPSRKVLKGLLVIGFSLMVVQTLIKAFALASVSSSQGWKVLFGNTVIVSGKIKLRRPAPCLVVGAQRVHPAHGSVGLHGRDPFVDRARSAGAARRDVGAGAGADHRQFDHVLLQPAVHGCRCDRSVVSALRGPGVSLAVLRQPAGCERT